MIQKLRIYLRLWRRKTYPWVALALAACRVIYLCGSEQEREKVRLMVALTKIDFVCVIEFINDLIW